MKIDLLNIPVYFINMNKDLQKRKDMEDRLKKLGFKYVNRIEAVENKENPKAGLSMSQHIALNKIEPPFIILEDDADPKYFVDEINVPDDADAVYLGNSQWGYMKGYSGFYLKYEEVPKFRNVYKIYNMLSSHAILYLTKEYVDVCKRTTKYCAEKYSLPMDVPFAMVQRFYNIYTINKPLFVQKDYPGKMTEAPRYTTKPLTAYRKYDSPDNRTGHVIKDEIIPN